MHDTIYYAFFNFNFVKPRLDMVSQNLSICLNSTCELDSKLTYFHANQVGMSQVIVLIVSWTDYSYAFIDIF